MIRNSIGTRPAKEPTEADLRWAAALFEAQMRFVQYNKHVALQIHMKDPRAEARLVSCFGGGSYYLPSTKMIRWRVAQAAMVRVLKQIEPFLTSLGRERLSAVREVLAEEALTELHQRKEVDVKFLAREAVKRAIERSEDDYLSVPSETMPSQQGKEKK